MSADVVTVDSTEAMAQLAREVERTVTGGTVLLLHGPLGAGKTTFVQALGAALGVPETITSPTFTVAAEYAVMSHPAVKKLVHLDLYRLADGHAASDAAVQDALHHAGDLERITAIEWAEKLGGHQFPRSRRLTFEHGSGSQQRVVTISA